MANKKKTKDKQRGIYSFNGSDGKDYRLTLKEKKFCDIYLDFKGNGARAAFEIYDCKNIRVAAAVASENLTKPNIIAYVEKELTERGFNDNNVEKHHLFTLTQFADLAAKNKAIDMFYKLKGRYPKDQLEVSIIQRYKDKSDDELKQLAGINK